MGRKERYICSERQNIQIENDQTYVKVELWGQRYAEDSS